MDFKNIFNKTKNTEIHSNSSVIKVDYSSKKINMLPLDYYKLKRKRLIVLLVILMFCLSTVYFAYFLYQVKAYTSWYDKQIYSIESIEGFSGLNEQISKFSEERNSQNLIFDLKKRIDSKSELLVDIEKNNKSILYTISTIEDELPNGIIFASLQVDSESAININGFAANNKDIAILIHNLKETNQFDSVFVDSISYNERVNTDNLAEISYAFSISCKFGGVIDETK
ncbi:MAG: PilN domain-containing protein [Acidaminobacteraceae bacterium]